MEERDEKTASTIKGNKWWDKVKDSRLFAGLITGLAGIAGAGIVYFGTILVGAKEERSRTFELLSNREAAAQTLQAKVFEVYVQHVVPALEDSVNDHKKVALLAGLHSNFSEFFDTRPVFEAFAEKIDDVIARHELSRLAKRVARRQAKYIKVHVPNPKNAIMSIEKTFSWPSVPEQTFRLAVHNVTLTILRPRRHYTKAESDSIKEVKPLLGEEGDNRIDDVSDLVAISILFAPMDTTKKDTIGVFSFDLSYMDTPYMDNIWMRHGDDSHHQVALRLVDIDTKKEEHEVTIEILHFPGDVYAATQRLPVKELLKGGHKQEEHQSLPNGRWLLALALGVVGILWFADRSKIKRKLVEARVAKIEVKPDQQEDDS